MVVPVGQRLLGDIGNDESKPYRDRGGHCDPPQAVSPHEPAMPSASHPNDRTQAA
jgi:hypothetical protein